MKMDAFNIGYLVIALSIVGYFAWQAFIADADRGGVMPVNFMMMIVTAFGFGALFLLIQFVMWIAGKIWPGGSENI